MWPWIKRWRDWAMNDLWPFYRLNSQPQALHYSYEKAGLTVHDQAVPWNAESLIVEARLRLAPSAGRRKTDYTLHIPGCSPVPAEELRRHEGDGLYRITFRTEPPGTTTLAEVMFRNHKLGQLTIPFLSCEQFLQNVRIQMPTLFVRLGEDMVACQTVVASQCKGILANAILTSPTSLVPLVDLDLQFELRNERAGEPQRLPVRLSSSQLAGRTAQISVMPRRFPRRIGTWVASWLLSGQTLASQRLRAIAARTFQKSLRIRDARFLLGWPKGPMTLARQVPPDNKPSRVGPCFLLGSSEPGMAGLCHLQVLGQPLGNGTPPVLMEQDVLITDGPTIFTPGTLNLSEIGHISGFDLCFKGHSLGSLSLCPAPTATFTNEGGFKPAHDYVWSPAAEEELGERLNQLLDGHD